LEKRVKDRYLDVIERDLDKAIDRARRAKDAGEPTSVGWLGNAVDLLSGLADRDVIPDTLTDQTSAHDPLMATTRRHDARTGRSPAQSTTRPNISSLHWRRSLFTWR